jgi:type IV pilus assembly protein PilA
MRTSHGFTLIELMIVVAIIGILATLAVPTYQERVIQTQASDGIHLTEFVRQSVSAYYAKNKRMPRDNAAAGLPEADKIIGNYVTGVAVKEGVISITYGNRSNRNMTGKKLSLRPAIVEGYPVVPIAWVCGNASVPDKMKVLGENDTSLPPPHLPVDCR